MPPGIQTPTIIISAPNTTSSVSGVILMISGTQNRKNVPSSGPQTEFLPPTMT